MLQLSIIVVPYVKYLIFLNRWNLFCKYTTFIHNTLLSGTNNRGKILVFFLFWHIFSVLTQFLIAIKPPSRALESGLFSIYHFPTGLSVVIKSGRKIFVIRICNPSDVPSYGHASWTITAQIANTIDILTLILHISDYSCINNQIRLCCDTWIEI